MEDPDPNTLKRGFRGGVRTAWVTALLCTIVVVGWQTAVVRYLWDGNWTGLFCIGSQLKMPDEAASGVARSAAPLGYDGAYYRLIARDPFFRRGWDRYIDDPGLRRRRIAVPLAAWSLVLGQDAFVDAAYIAIIAISVLLGVYWTGRLFAQLGHSARWGAIFLLVPATLTSIDRMLLDGPLCAVFAGIALRTTRNESPWLLWTLAPLVKETGMLFAAAAAVSALRNRQWRGAVLAAATQLPALAWFGFVYANAGPSGVPAIASRPVIGHIERLLTVRSYPSLGAYELIVQGFDMVAIVCLLAACVLGLKCFWPYRGALEISAALFAALGLCLGSQLHLEEAYGFARPVSPLLWALLVQGIVRRHWLAVAAPLGLAASVGLSLGSQLLRIIHAI